jgi:hypothetical protein
MVVVIEVTLRDEKCNEHAVASARKLRRELIAGKRYRASDPRKCGGGHFNLRYRRGEKRGEFPSNFGERRIAQRAVKTRRDRGE